VSTAEVDMWHYIKKIIIFKKIIFFLKKREREREKEAIGVAEPSYDRKKKVFWPLGVAEAPLWATKVVRPPPWANPQILAHGSGSATPKGQNPFFFFVSAMGWLNHHPWGGSATPDQPSGWLSHPTSFSFIYIKCQMSTSMVDT